MSGRWTHTVIGEVCSVIAGQSPKGEFYNDAGEGLPFYQGKKEFGDRYIGAPTKWTTHTTKEAEAGDILMSVRAPVGPVNFATQKICIGRGLAAIRAGQGIDKSFLYYQLLANQEKIKGNEGAVFASINKTQIESLPFSFPLLPEQKRIVAILDDAFAAIDTVTANTETNLANARELFESYLDRLFSQQSEGWEIKPLESLAVIVNGYAFKSGDFSPQNKVKSIKITNVGVYEFVQENDNYLPKKYGEEYSQYQAYEGDVVVALTRTIISSGLKVAVVPGEYDGALVNQRVAAVRVDEKIMPKEILRAFLSTRTAVNYVRSNVNELMQPNLSIKDLKTFPIPVPPPDRMAVVSVQVAEIRELTDQLVSKYLHKLKISEELKQSLLQNAFTGELSIEFHKDMAGAVA